METKRPSDAEHSQDAKRYAIAGLGSRGLLMFATPLLRDFAGRVELVSFFDQNKRRLENAQKVLERKIPIYTDFDKMHPRRIYD